MEERSGGISSQCASANPIFHSSMLQRGYIELLVAAGYHLFCHVISHYLKWNQAGEFSLSFLHTSELPKWALQQNGTSHFLQLPSTETTWQLMNITSFPSSPALDYRRSILDSNHNQEVTSVLASLHQYTNKAPSPWQGSREDRKWEVTSLSLNQFLLHRRFFPGECHNKPQRLVTTSTNRLTYNCIRI